MGCTLLCTGFWDEPYRSLHAAFSHVACGVSYKRASAARTSRLIVKANLTSEQKEKKLTSGRINNVSVCINKYARSSERLTATLYTRISLKLLTIRRCLSLRSESTPCTHKRSSHRPIPSPPKYSQVTPGETTHEKPPKLLALSNQEEHRRRQQTEETSSSVLPPPSCRREGVQEMEATAAAWGLMSVPPLPPLPHGPERPPRQRQATVTPTASSTAHRWGPPLPVEPPTTTP